ncbi:hypothetical protein N7481_006394 [Penicillium waksmanii]|uniref:uncharacterized protein n=1 Tax=Penicillium waksmanii TaxID=69791 RepID=UPI002547B3E9|nr:uncharacterized protein N7481_006394 [Penicillium waksmanii]KAJ5984295.1 hypothetical protein N7481_006394 [Penicillium waksmanii]
MKINVFESLPGGGKGARIASESRRANQTMQRPALHCTALHCAPHRTAAAAAAAHCMPVRVKVESRERGKAKFDVSHN